jgi:hypothetical protein
MIMCKRVVSVGLILLASFCSSACSAGGPAPLANNSNTVDEAGRGVGSDARLFLEGRNEIFVAVDEKAFNDLINTLSYGGGGVDELIRSGKVFTTPNNTRVRILEIATGKIKIRVLEGDKLMTDGWVHEMWVK